MGILKIVGKTIGTATLIVTGTASTVLKSVSDAMGFEIGSELLGSAKDASFNGIRYMWGDKDIENAISSSDKVEDVVRNGTQSQMARTAKQAAEVAKKNAEMAQKNNDPKYEHYMEKYEYYMEQYERYKQ